MDPHAVSVSVAVGVPSLTLLLLAADVLVLRLQLHIHCSCVLEVCRQSNQHVTIKDIAKALAVDVHEMGRYVKKVDKHMRNNKWKQKPLQQLDKCNTNYVTKIVSELIGVEFPQARKRISEIANKLMKLSKENHNDLGRQPQPVALAAVFLAINAISVTGEIRYDESGCTIHKTFEPDDELGKRLSWKRDALASKYGFYKDTLLLRVTELQKLLLPMQEAAGMMLSSAA